MRPHHVVIGFVFGTLTLFWVGFVVDIWHGLSPFGGLALPLGLVGFLLIWFAAWGCDVLWDRHIGRLD